MLGYIDNYDFGEMEVMRYWAPPASWTDQKKKDNARARIFSCDYLGAEKKDGYFAKLVKDDDGNILLYSRSRGVNKQFANKYEWVPHLSPFFDVLPKGTCLLGELYLPSQPGSKNVTTIMGCLKDKAIERQNKGEKLRFYVFDCLALNGESKIDEPFSERVSLLSRLAEGLSTIGYSSKDVQFAEYLVGRQLWNKLQEILAEGGEGMVITHSGASYEPGKRPSKTTLKIKKELQTSIDCFFTGETSPATRQYSGKELETWTYWENMIDGTKIEGELFKEYQKGAMIIPVTKGWFYGWAGSLEIAVLKKAPGRKCKINGIIYDNAEIFPIGYLSGLTEEIRANPDRYSFRPIEVTAMEWSAISCSLRHGKFLGFRDDIEIKDCLFSKIVG